MIRVIINKWYVLLHKWMYKINKWYFILDYSKVFYTFISFLNKKIRFSICKSLPLTKNSFIMQPKSFMELITPEVIQSFARKNYNTYVAHCEARKLKPMVFQEFLKNYAI